MSSSTTTNITATLLNYTPHPITVMMPDSRIPQVTLPWLGTARAVEEITPRGNLSFDPYGDAGFYVEVPWVSKRFGAVEGLPTAAPGIRVIVSQIVFDACPDRTDLMVPHDIVRDVEGRIVGCRGFAGRP